MRVHYRIHKYQREPAPFFAVDEEFATHWAEVTYWGAPLHFRSLLGPIEFIRAVDAQGGTYTHEDLLREMVTD